MILIIIGIILKIIPFNASCVYGLNVGTYTPRMYEKIVDCEVLFSEMFLGCLSAKRELFMYY